MSEIEDRTAGTGLVREQVELCQPADYPGLRLMRADFRTRRFPRHRHEGFGVGVIERGALGFDYRGEHLVAPAGRINTVNPDEVHTGHAQGEQGWSYRMFYGTRKFLANLATEISERPARLPLFTAGVIDDPPLAVELMQLHILLAAPRTGRLVRESTLLSTFARLIGRHTEDSVAGPAAGREREAIRRAMACMEANLEKDLALADLAAAACLSRYHFIRVFARATGLTPHAWLMQLRAQRAREMIAGGRDIAEAAARTGFADQSHLTRTFRRLWGYTPGQMRNLVQDR